MSSAFNRQQATRQADKALFLIIIFFSIEKKKSLNALRVFATLRACHVPCVPQSVVTAATFGYFAASLTFSTKVSNRCQLNARLRIAVGYSFDFFI